MVQDFDEQLRVAAMLVENPQREGLGVLEEARGIKRLADMGLSQREIARQLGRGQSHVSKRLALLTLPAEIQAAIDQPRDVAHRDSRGITVADALELTRLADHPERQVEAFRRGRSWNGGVAEAVTEHLRELERERARQATRSQLMTAGVRILKEQELYGWTGSRERPLLGQGHDHAAIRMTLEQHQAEPCHAAAIDREGRAIHVCWDPSRHAGADPKTAAEIVKARQEQEEQREDNRDGEPSRDQVERAVAEYPGAARHAGDLVLVTETGAAIRWARAMLEPGAAVILDTETVDLGGPICEIAVIDTAGEVLLDQLVDPGEPISPAGTWVHGITDADVAGAPRWDRVLPRDRHVLAYNADFDRGVVLADTRRHGLHPGRLVEAGRWSCLMRARSDRHRSGRRLALYGPHRALGDCQAALEVLRAIAAAPPSIRGGGRS